MSECIGYTTEKERNIRDIKVFLANSLTKIRSENKPLKPIFEIKESVFTRIEKILTITFSTVFVMISLMNPISDLVGLEGPNEILVNIAKLFFCGFFPSLIISFLVLGIYHILMFITSYVLYGDDYCKNQDLSYEVEKFLKRFLNPISSLYSYFKYRKSVKDYNLSVSKSTKKKEKIQHYIDMVNSENCYEIFDVVNVEMISKILEN